MVDLFNPEDDPTADACYPEKLEMCTCIVKHEVRPCPDLLTHQLHLSISVNVCATAVVHNLS